MDWHAVNLGLTSEERRLFNRWAGHAKERAFLAAEGIGFFVELAGPEVLRLLPQRVRDHIYELKSMLEDVPFLVGEEGMLAED